MGPWNIYGISDGNQFSMALLSEGMQVLSIMSSQGPFLGDEHKYLKHFRDKRPQ
jgi:hypothetical protein